MRRARAVLIAAAIGGGAGALLSASLPMAVAAESVVMAPVPKIDAPASPKLATAIFAGGCYWGVEGTFSHIRGVRRAESGFAGGPANRRVDYDMVGGGDTGYAESVRVTYDPRQVSYGTLLRIFFSVIADPTTLDYQGPDHGTQYRSALFPQTPDQTKVAAAYLTQMGRSKLWRGRIVTRIETVGRFQPAASDHQDFLEKNPDHPYIQRWDMPKVAALKKLFPQNYSARPSA